MRLNKFKNKYDVVFYYPQHFNRSSIGTNPFFDPIIKLCKEDKLNYILLEEPDKKTKFPRNKAAIKFDFLMYVIILLRKIFPLIFFDKTRCYDQLIGRILNPLTLYQFSSTIYITISNSMITVLSGFSKNSCVYDLQHGIIHDIHKGYFDDDGNLRNQLKNKNICFLLYGKGFADIFLKKGDFLDDKNKNRVKVVGNVIENNNVNNNHSTIKNKIVYTLQINGDLSKKDLNLEKKELDNFIKSNEEIFLKNKISLLLKHHPRFDNVIELDDIISGYSFVSITTCSISNLVPIVFLHITKSSTTIFDFSVYGIPSFIIPNDFGLKIFNNIFNYPLASMNLKELIEVYFYSHKKYIKYSNEIKKWEKFFYEPFNRGVFTDLLQLNKNEILTNLD